MAADGWQERLGHPQLFVLQTGILSWFALNDVQNQIAAAAAGVVTERLPSFGAFQLDLETTYSFGIPKEVRFPGVLMDVGWSKMQIVAKDNSEEKFIAFNRSAGARGSANEHAVPEQLFSTPETPAEGVSAVKAIAIAAAQGQRIYTITQENLSNALSELTLDSATQTDIRNAVNGGLQVTAHQHPISYMDFGGAGYIILDPETGSGAYKISGGADGARVKAFFASLLLGILLVITAAVVISGLLIAPLTTIVGMLTLWSGYKSGDRIKKAWQECDPIAALALTVTIFTATMIQTLAEIPKLLNILNSGLQEMIPEPESQC